MMMMTILIMMLLKILETNDDKTVTMMMMSSQELHFKYWSQLENLLDGLINLLQLNDNGYDYYDDASIGKMIMIHCGFGFLVGLGMIMMGRRRIMTMMVASLNDHDDDNVVDDQLRNQILTSVMMI